MKPWYRQLCKRPCFHDEYLDAFNEPNTHLVHTDGKGVEEITETGVVVDGVEYELDCIIYASGFEVGTEFTRRWGYDVCGRDGEMLSAHWAEGMSSLHGIHVHGFPNMFIVGPAQGANLISNIPHNLTEAASTIATMIAHANDTGADEIEVTSEAEASVGREARGRRPDLRWRPDLHPRLLQQRGQGRRREGDPQLVGLSRRTRGVFRVHRSLAVERRVRGDRIPLTAGAAVRGAPEAVELA